MGTPDDALAGSRRCLVFVSRVFRPFAMQHPGAVWALLEMTVQLIHEAENR